MIAGKCPKCEKPVLRGNLHGCEVGQPMGRTWKAVQINCPSCNTILGIAIDPVALKTDIVGEVLEGLGAAPKRR